MCAADEIDDRAYSGINSAINKAEILMYECRDLVEKFEALVNQASRYLSLSLYLSIYLCIYLSIYLCIYLSIYLSIL